MLSMMRPIALVIALTVTSVLAGAQGKPSSPQTADHMKEHYEKVRVVEAAVIRGDLDAVREPAAWLAAHESSKELDKASASQVSSMRQSARKAADAKDIQTAATATATMLATCGDCHRAAAVVPAPAAVRQPMVGGVVGHMLKHQQAIDQMADGLIIPSAAQWKAGAEALKSVPLRASDLPRDPKLTREVAAAEDRVHLLAEQAATAAEGATRVKAYAQIISACAQCHGLHGRIWGPGLPKTEQR
jgi:mono/diheme cytochrome c family protein